MIRFACAAAAALVLAAAAPALAQSAGATVTLAFETGRPEGQVRVALFDSEAGWTADRPVGGAVVDASGPATAVFHDLPPGEYAAKVLHDVDGDGTMDFNPFGIPTEPFAFSNNAVGRMGPASWAQARFTVAGDVAQTIRLR